MTSTAALAVDGLVRRFGTLTAVDGLSFTVAPGTLVAILGPNGAGKTTTVETCEGFTRPDAGTVRLLGHDPYRERGTVRPRIGVMLQAGGAHAGATAGQMLRLVARCAARPHDPDDLLRLLGIAGQADTQVRRLSGGQVQRLSLAMALVGRPEVLFLDEPSAGLDPQARNLVWDIVRAARADGVTVLLTTHLMEEAEALADRVLILDHGRLVADDTPKGLTGTEQWLRFSSAPGLDLAALTGQLTGVAVREESVGQYLATGDISPAVMLTVLRFCEDHGAPAGAVETGRRSLNEVYLDLTGREVRS